MSDDDTRNVGSEDSISGGSAAMYFAHDPSLADLLNAHGIGVRDFMLVSFLSDQGPLTIRRLAGILSIDSAEVVASARRLASAGLVFNDQLGDEKGSASIIRLTPQGLEIAGRIDSQL